MIIIDNMILSILALVIFQLYHFKSSTRPFNDIFTQLTSINGRQDPYLLFQSIHTTEDPLYDRIGVPTLNPSSEHLKVGSKAMVASDIPVCSTMGISILLKGGNAADAAVTVALCIGSINSHSSGIGGGGYIVSKHGDDYISIDAREMAPKHAFKDMYDKYPILSKVGGLAVAVPGELHGLYKLFDNHGSKNLTWKQLIEPVITLNEQGFVCSKVFENVVIKEEELVLNRIPALKKCWDFIYKDEECTTLVEQGDIIARPNYARTLELIANNGSSAIFYDPNGPIVQSLIPIIHQFGGIIEAEDFARYDAVVERPISTEFSLNGKDNYTLFTSNGASSGLALVAGLKFFESVINKEKVEDDLLYNHKLIESFKWLGSIRSEFGDVNKTYAQSLIDKYTDTTWIEEVLQQGGYSDSQTFNYTHYQPKYDLVNNQGTSHFSILDEDNNAVSMTTTVNLLFGSLVYDSHTGIILNNEMDDFSQPNISNAFNLTPSIFNFIDSYKRPLSSTSPTIIINSTSHTPDFLIGAAGGSRITTAILQAIIRVYYQKLNLLDTISFPRIHHQLIPEFIMIENLTMYGEEFTNSIVEKMKSLGHEFYISGAVTAMNGIKRNIETGLIEGVSDYWRKRGKADGY
ncbi:putative gamma glutamyltransferase [Scheffersomyces coipomensis]|uniref:putative gamma glutamyltransferase n=1 Tax=Scheffersomyces coipomensis TaxID=1788519 RepID=UPI00315D6244